MSSQGGELIQTQATSLAVAEANAAIAHLTMGGIVESAAGAITPSMDGVVQEHLKEVAIRSVGGDSLLERPTYIFNPASNMLIKFSFHRGGLNESYNGLFADVVELDSEGNAVHGVSSPDIRNAFDSSLGFIPVNVGENKKGFTPSAIPLKFEKTDEEVEEEISFPNIELATLANLLRAEPVDDETSLKDFLSARTEEYHQTEVRVRRRLNRSYMPSEQALADSTNPNLHLIITDKEDTSEAERITRELGMFPVVLSLDTAQAGIDFHEQFPGAPSISRFSTFFPPEDHWETVCETLSQQTPAFVTWDIAFFTGPEDPDGSRAQRIFSIGSKLGIYSEYQKFGREEAPMKALPVFRRIINNTLFFEPDNPANISKEAHGRYEMPLEQGNPANMEAYASLLRKSKLDFALTQYLRGVDKL